MSNLTSLLNQINACTLCLPHLPHGVNPVLQASSSAKILIAGQAPGIKVHKSGLPFNDASGDRLRQWLGVSKTQFYDPHIFAIVPMGFCYPGSGKSGDLPPRSECASKWRNSLLQTLSQIELTLLIGQYSQQWHLNLPCNLSVTQTVKQWQSYLPHYLPTPHPSPRNNIWLRKNVWFEAEVIPWLQNRVQQLIQTSEK